MAEDGHRPNTGIQYAVVSMPEEDRKHYHGVAGHLRNQGAYSDQAAGQVIDAINNQSGEQRDATINRICQEARDKRDLEATECMVSRFDDYQREQFEQAQDRFRDEGLLTAARGLAIAGIVRDDNSVRASHRIDDLAREARANERSDGPDHVDAEPQQLTDERDKEPLVLTDQRITTQAHRAALEITGHGWDDEGGLSH